MNVFGDYSEYYNLLYQEKNYSEEIQYVSALLKKNCQNCKSILDYGCGTGNHDFLLAQNGFDVCGVDLSEQMLAIANTRLKNYQGSGAVSFIQGNMTDAEVPHKFDAVISLFHAINYLAEPQQTMQTFQNAYDHLADSGVFLFDFWYGPGVLTDPPRNKLKKIENEHIRINRFTVPVMEYDKNIVHVNFEVIIENKKNGILSRLNEHHAMRYIFLPETVYMLKQAGFSRIQAYKWLTSEPLDTSWYGVIVASKEV